MVLESQNLVRWNILGRESWWSGIACSVNSLTVVEICDIIVTMLWRYRGCLLWEEVINDGNIRSRREWWLGKPEAKLRFGHVLQTQVNSMHGPMFISTSTLHVYRCIFCLVMTGPVSYLINAVIALLDFANNHVYYEHSVFMSSGTYNSSHLKAPNSFQILT